MGMASMRSDPIEVGRSLEDMLHNCSRRTSNNFRTRRELEKMAFNTVLPDTGTREPGSKAGRRICEYP